jgi:hypothetical protein
MNPRWKPAASPSSCNNNAKQKGDGQGMQRRFKRNLTQALGQVPPRQRFGLTGQDAVGLIRRLLHMGFFLRAQASVSHALTFRYG